MFWYKDDWALQPYSKYTRQLLSSLVFIIETVMTHYFSFTGINKKRCFISLPSTQHQTDQTLRSGRPFFFPLNLLELRRACPCIRPPTYFSEMWCQIVTLKFQHHSVPRSAVGEKQYWQRAMSLIKIKEDSQVDSICPASSCHTQHMLSPDSSNVDIWSLALSVIHC